MPILGCGKICPPGQMNTPNLARKPRPLTTLSPPPTILQDKSSEEGQEGVPETASEEDPANDLSQVRFYLSCCRLAGSVRAVVRA